MARPACRFVADQRATVSTILIGVDASERSEDAIAFGSQLAQASGAYVVSRTRSEPRDAARSPRSSSSRGDARPRARPRVTLEADAALVIVGYTHAARSATSGCGRRRGRDHGRGAWPSSPVPRTNGTARPRGRRAASARGRAARRRRPWRDDLDGAVDGSTSAMCGRSSTRCGGSRARRDAADRRRRRAARRAQPPRRPARHRLARVARCARSRRRRERAPAQRSLPGGVVRAASRRRSAACSRPSWRSGHDPAADRLRRFRVRARGDPRRPRAVRAGRRDRRPRPPAAADGGRVPASPARRCHRPSSPRASRTCGRRSRRRRARSPTRASSSRAPPVWVRSRACASR